MAKKGMQIKYKSQKRERNKNLNENSTSLELKSIIKTLIGVIVFLVVSYLCVLGLEKIGLFEQGYVAPNKEETKFDYEFITMGTVLNRKEKTYYVIFDNYKTSITENTYINDLLKSQDKYTIYKVDMNENENKKYISEEANKKAKTVNDIKINGLTLIKVTNGKIVDYVIGSKDIEEYLK